MKFSIGTDNNKTFYIMRHNFPHPLLLLKILKSGEHKFQRTGFTIFKTKQEAEEMLEKLQTS